ncbi:MAG: thiamine pyrophosphate-binding protein [Pseudoruegeria sp.]
MNVQIPVDEKNKTYQTIANSIFEHGIDTIFGLMGDANLYFIDHFVRACRGKFVPAAYDGNATLMALAYAQVSGKIGVASVTHGPALTNSITPLTEGARGNIPMVLFAGDTPTADRRNLQDIDQRALVAVTGAGWEQVRTPQTASVDIAHAFYRARTERRPIVLNIPADFMWKDVPHTPTVYPVFQTPAFVPDGPTFEDALGMIASARRPLILAGYGAIDAKPALIDLAERIDAPLATTLRAKDLFRGHPNAIGLFGTLSTPEAYSIIAQADCIISFGASLHQFTTDRGLLCKGKRIVQVNDRPDEAGQTLHSDAVLIADAKLTAENFLMWINEAEAAPSGFASEFAGRDVAAHPVPPPRAQKTGTIDFTTALNWLETALPQDRVLVTDGGRFMTEVWCHISAPDPRSFVLTANFGAIGLGLQEAVGAAAAVPNRPVTLFTGDGGFMLGGINEFNTAVRLGQDLIVIVCNDAAYGAEYVQFEDRQMDPALTLFDWPSFAQVATSLGGQGVTVRTLEDLEQAGDVIAKRDGPILIELMLDPSAMPRMRI